MKIKVALRIDGMMCQKSCGSTVRNALLEALSARSKRAYRSEGGSSVAKVEVSYEHRSAIIEVDEDEDLSPSVQKECIDAVNDIGFGAELIANCTPDIVLQVEGMMCQKNCGGTVFNCAMAIHGVVWAEASFAEKNLKVWGNSLDAHEIIESMDSVGFTASLLESSDKSQGFEEVDDNNDNDLMEIVVSPLKGDVITSDLETKNEITLYISNHISDVNTKILEKSLFALHGVQNVQVNKLQKSVKIWGNCDVDLILKTSADVDIELSLQKNTPLKKSRKGSQTPAKDSSSSSSSSLQQPSKATSCKVLEVFVEGLSVSTALSSVESSLKTLAGVRSVNINALLSDKLVVTFDEEVCSSDILLERISSYGFEPEVTSLVSFGQGNTKTVVFKIGGMSCANCSIKIEKYIKSQIGVLSADVSCMTDKAKVVLIEGGDESAVVGIRSLIEGVESLGYNCSLHGIDTMKNDDEDENSELNLWWRLLIFACALGIPVTVLHLSMLGSKALMDLFGQPYLCSGGVTLGQTIMFCLNVPLQIIVGYRFYRGAYMGAKHGNCGMDALVVTGTSVTFTYSIFQLGMACHAGCPTRHIFLEASGMLLMFVTIGKYLEAYAKGKTYSAITSLLKLQPNEALLVIQNDSSLLQNNNGKSTSNGRNLVVTAAEIVGNEATKLIQLDLVQKGDILKVLPGSRIPTDGRVVYGSSFVDESVITGESIPALRSLGDRVFGSTINQNSLMFIEVTSTGSESALSQIVKLVEEAQMNKAPVQAYADRIAASFTPFVIALSICTFAVWSSLSAVFHVVPKSWFVDDYGDPWLFSMLFAISVVVISCPCALGLATPTAIMVGTSVGAKLGILIKGGPAFETAHKITTVIFDKTGTLTVGCPEVTDFIGCDESNFSKQEILRIAASAEQGSEHPLAAAVLRAAAAQNIELCPISDSKAIPGKGVECCLEYGRALVGNRGLFESSKIVINPLIDSYMWDIEIQGKTAICVCIEGTIIGVMGIADIPKTESKETIQVLRGMGIDCWMVTGDNKVTAEAIAEALDIPKDRVAAGMLPADKLEKVKELQGRGQCVAVVGDGINDSPALAQADVGIAVGAGTQVAIEAADMVLVRNNLFDVVVAINLAQVVFRRIQWNFVWALVYNVVAIPFAAGVWFPWTHVIVPPQFAGLAMAMSSISVVLSSLSLNLYRKPLMNGNSNTDSTFDSAINSSPQAVADRINLVMKSPNSVASIYESARKNLSKLRDKIEEKISRVSNSFSADGDRPYQYNKVSLREDEEDEEVYGEMGVELGIGSLRGLQATHVRSPGGEVV